MLDGMGDSHSRPMSQVAAVLSGRLKLGFEEAVTGPRSANRLLRRITELYEECRGLGLRIGPDDVFDIHNVVVLLEGANEEQGLRYFKQKGSSIPELSWTRDRSEEHTSELQSPCNLVCRLLLEKKQGRHDDTENIVLTTSDYLESYGISPDGKQPQNCPVTLHRFLV